MKMNLVSVIIPVFNCERYLSEALESVLRQKHVNFEIIAINDGSTDGSASILDSYADQIICIQQTNSGQAKAMNEGLKLAKGEFIAYLDADDICFPDRLCEQVDYLAKNSDVDLVYSDIEYINQDGIKLGIKHTKIPDPLRLLYFNFIPHSSVLHRKKVVDVVGVFDATYLNHDWDLWVRISEYSKFGYIPKPLVQYRVHALNISRTRRYPLNHYRRTRMIMLEKTWIRRERPFWLRILLERARFEWWLLNSPNISEKAGKLWWHIHAILNAIEMKFVKWIAGDKAIPAVWLQKP